jgi:CRP-like cAMP-binding protein
MTSTFLPSRVFSADPSGVRLSASPVDQALTLFLADETEAALRWGAAALERDPLSAGALVVTSRLLDQMGRSRAAVDGLRLATRRAIDMGDLPLALAAIDDLRILGADVRAQLDEVANAFCRGSDRLQLEQSRSLAPSFSDFSEPLSPFLSGPPLASKVTQILQSARQAHDSEAGSEPVALAPLPLFSALSREALREVLSTFQMITVPSGHRLIQEGEEGDAAYIVAHGEVEISRRAGLGDNKPRLGLMRLGSGAFFGELSLIARLPSPVTATSTRPSILLVAKRDLLGAIAARRSEVETQLAAHCRRSSLENLGWASPVVAAIPLEERARLVERLQMRVFERGERLVHDGEEPKGLHLIVSGEVGIVAREWSERVLLATLAAGETVGEVELVLCRQAYADAVAMGPTVSLFLPREEYSALVHDRPALLQGLYATAVRRHAETRLALDAGSASVADDWPVEEETATRMLLPDPRPARPQALPPPAPSFREPPPRPSARPPSSRPPPAPRAPPSVRPAPASVHPRVQQQVEFPSVAPTAASVRPSAPPSRRRGASLSGLRSRLQVPTARLGLTAAVALVGSAAGVFGVLALHDGPFRGAGSSAAAAGPPAMAVAAPPSPDTALSGTAAARPPLASEPPKPILRMRMPPKPKPRIVVAPEVAAAAAATPAASMSAQPVGTVPPPVAASSSPLVSGPAGGSKLTNAHALSSGEDFGGRE